MLPVHKKLTLLLLVIASSGFVAIVFATTNSEPKPYEAKAIGPGQLPPSDGSDKHVEQTRRELLALRFGPALLALGDRIEKPGKGRLTYTGTLQRAGETQPIPFMAICQQPGQLRFQAGNGPGVRTITFNGRRTEGHGSLSSEDESLVEMLVYDTAEGFFEGQMDNAATRFLGSRFRDDDGTAVNYTGPYHDIYQVMDQMITKGDVVQRSKLFFFNSDTLLLERVRYQIETDGIRKDVEVQIGDWQKVEGQMIPGRLVRLENNLPVLTLVITSASVGPEVADGSFTSTQGR